MAALLACIVLTAAAQMLLKIGADPKRTFIANLLHAATITGYGIFLVVTVLTVYVMQAIEMKTVTAWVGLTYILVTAGALLFLKEKVTLKKVVGPFLIVFGFFVFHI